MNIQLDSLTSLAASTASTSGSAAGAPDATDRQVAVLKQALDAEQSKAVQLLQMMGLGVNLDVKG